MLCKSHIFAFQTEQYFFYHCNMNSERESNTQVSSLASLLKGSSLKQKKKGHRRIKTQMNMTVSTVKTRPCRMTELICQQDIVEEVNEESGENRKAKKGEQIVINMKKQKIVHSSLLSFLKGKLIIEQLVDVIEGGKLLDLSVQKNVEFMFLICSRALKFLKHANIFLNPHQNNKKVEELSLIRLQSDDIRQLSHFSQECALLMSKAEAKWRSYDCLINQIQRKFRKKMSNLMSNLFHLSRNKQKQIFIDGIEGIDFSSHEQISFTHSNYIADVLNSKQINNQFSKQHRLKRFLKCYKKICMIESTTDFSSQISESSEVGYEKQITLQEFEANFIKKVDDILLDD